MKKILFFLLFSQFAIAQQLSQIELLGVISDEICNEITSKNIKVENEGILGIYMLKTVNKHKEDVEFYYGSYLGKEAVLAKLGEEIGYHLGLKCPEIYETIILTQSSSFETELLTVKGKLNKIVKNQFLSFIVKEDSGKSHEFLLLNSFDTSYLLTDKILQIGDQIEVSYYVSELYDAKIGRYINYNIVTFIEKK